jgi:CHAD domain-containing protein
MCFREIEVEVRAKGRAGRRLLRAAISRLVAAGCRAEPPIPKVIRVLGQRASGPPDVTELRGRLRLLGAKAGAVRDTDVLTGRLRAKANLLPDQDDAGVEQLIRRLDDQAGQARAALLQELASPGYDQLLDSLVRVAARPPITAQRPGLASQPAADLAGGLTRRPWRRLKRAAGALGKDSPDAQWHAVRIRAKRCRYAAEAVAPVCGRQAYRFAAAIAAVQDILGDHQDTVVAEAWLRANGAALSPACVAAGELIAAQRRERTRLRSKWPKAWKRASAKKLRRWILRAHVM